jgi:hypothetical protein
MTPHFLVFVGASPSLSTELVSLRSRFIGIEVIAPAAKKSERGLTRSASIEATASLTRALKSRDTQRESARLSVWAYEPTESAQFGFLWETFGKAAWIELLPRTLNNKDRPSRLYIENRIDPLMQLLHLISGVVYGRRKTSPLPLPFRNFRNRITRELREYWYRGADLNTLPRLLEGAKDRLRILRAGDSHVDDRALLFAPARDNACHGQPHPMGDLDSCFVEGRFRFGAALFPGFHYDVSCRSGNLECTLEDCRGVLRDLRPEKRKYINIFPNDHLLPAFLASFAKIKRAHPLCALCLHYAPVPFLRHKSLLSRFRHEVD